MTTEENYAAAEIRDADDNAIREFRAEVGGRVIITEDRKPPRIATIESVTPSGQFSVEGIKGRFRGRRYGGHFRLTGTGRYGGGTGAIPYDEESFKRLADGQAEWQAEQDKKQADRDARRLATETRERDQREWVRATVNIAAARQPRLPTGQAVYVFPDLIDHGERSPGVPRYCVVMTSDHEDYDFEDGKKKRMHRADFTVWRGSERFGRGFYSGYSDRCPTEETAIVEALATAIFELG